MSGTKSVVSDQDLSHKNGETGDDISTLPEELEDPLCDEALKKLVPSVVGNEAATETLHKLRDLHKEHEKIYDEYMQEKLMLEQKFELKFFPNYKQRREQLSTSTLPDFWSKTFENCPLLRENITERDGVVLRYLTDLTCETNNKLIAEQENEYLSKDKPVGSFMLIFRFRDNPFFENDVLTKTYMTNEDDHEEISEARGCKILWKKGMDLTVRTLKKKAKNGRVLIKKQANESFFNFFTPPKNLSEAAEAEADPSLVKELEELMDADLELGECIRAEVIPRALLFYLGIVEEDEEDDDDDEDDSDDDSDDSDDDEPGVTRMQKRK